MRTKVNGGDRKRYTPEFKQAAIQKLVSGEYTLKRLSEELGVSVVSLIKWRKESVNPGRGNQTQSMQSDHDEIARLRSELETLKAERDRLRRGIAYLTGVID
jgi:transposase